MHRLRPLDAVGPRLIRECSVQEFHPSGHHWLACLLSTPPQHLENRSFPLFLQEKSANMAEMEITQTAPSDDVGELPRCADYDEDCPSIENKVHCWLYDPARGFCPWLAAPKDT